MAQEVFARIEKKFLPARAIQLRAVFDEKNGAGRLRTAHDPQHLSGHAGLRADAREH